MNRLAEDSPAFQHLLPDILNDEDHVKGPCFDPQTEFIVSPSSRSSNRQTGASLCYDAPTTAPPAQPPTSQPAKIRSPVIALTNEVTGPSLLDELQAALVALSKDRYFHMVTTVKEVVENIADENLEAPVESVSQVAAVVYNMVQQGKPAIVMAAVVYDIYSIGKKATDDRTEAEDTRYKPWVKAFHNHILGLCREAFESRAGSRTPEEERVVRFQTAFLGHLFNRGLLNNDIVVQCLGALLGLPRQKGQVIAVTPTPLDLEMACILLNVCGLQVEKSLDKFVFVGMMDRLAHFQQVTTNAALCANMYNTLAARDTGWPGQEDYTSPSFTSPSFAAGRDEEDEPSNEKPPLPFASLNSPLLGTSQPSTSPHHPPQLQVPATASSGGTPSMQSPLQQLQQSPLQIQRSPPQQPNTPPLAQQPTTPPLPAQQPPEPISEESVMKKLMAAGLSKNALEKASQPATTTSRALNPGAKAFVPGESYYTKQPERVFTDVREDDYEQYNIEDEFRYALQQEDAKNRTVYMVGIDTLLPESELLEFVQSCGRLNKVRLCGDTTNRTMYGFFEYRTREEAEELIRRNKTNLGRFVLNCSWARSAIRDAMSGTANLKVRNINFCDDEETVLRESCLKQQNWMPKGRGRRERWQAGQKYDGSPSRQHRNHDSKSPTPISPRNESSGAPLVLVKKQRPQSGTTSPALSPYTEDRSDPTAPEGDDDLDVMNPIPEDATDKASKIIGAVSRGGKDDEVASQVRSLMSRFGAEAVSDADALPEEIAGRALAMALRNPDYVRNGTLHTLLTTLTKAIHSNPYTLLSQVLTDISQTRLWNMSGLTINVCRFLAQCLSQQLFEQRVVTLLIQRKVPANRQDEFRHGLRQSLLKVHGPVMLPVMLFPGFCRSTQCKEDTPTRTRPPGLVAIGIHWM
eukprot:Sspe_Gene.4426::Locus_1452_Transcript_1_1_Confidence_1.000_Length_2966::g.4426::m.4426